MPDYQRLRPSEDRITWEIPLEVVTPLYGGGARTREVDQGTPVRTPSIRGQLRFWWRALYGGSYGDAASLYARERALFGGLGKEPEQVERSRVGVEVRDLRRSDLTREDVTLRDPAAYALWPARATTQGGRQPPAERWAPGMGFTLMVFLMPGSDVATDCREVEGTLRAWLLFGGIGGRTRRGCGALGITDETARAQWLPESLDPGTIRAWLSPGKAAGQGYPSLAGSRVCIGQFRLPEDAWHDSINWLRDFRQGHATRLDTADQGQYARQYPPQAQGRAGRSRWPEPDLIRRIFAAYDHAPLIEDSPHVWPRAQFGLPIQFRFQNRDRNGNFYKNRPPPPGTLNWKDGESVYQRLASPLIVKPVQARNGRFAASALWLKRTLPSEAMVGIRNKHGPDLLGPAPLAQMPESPLFTPLSGKPNMEEAFMDWLQTAQRLSGGTL
jgi:CRISPR-associated protein Cmr1